MPHITYQPPVLSYASGTITTINVLLQKTLPTSDASPARSESKSDHNDQGVTLRQKRPREEITLNDGMDYTRSMLKDFKDEQDRKLDTFKCSVADFREQQDRKLDSLWVHSSTEYLSQQNKELQEKDVKMESEQTENSVYIN